MLNIDLLVLDLGAGVRYGYGSRGQIIDDVNFRCEDIQV